jgi:RNA-directed DNA polymerase
MLRNFPKKELIKGWLKAGFVFQGKLNPTEQGTPQGGVISPLLANIGLHGARNVHKNHQPETWSGAIRRRLYRYG